MGIRQNNYSIKIITLDNGKYEEKVGEWHKTFHLLLDRIKGFDYKEASIIDYDTGETSLSLRTIQ
jgi:hypothetical protein